MNNLNEQTGELNVPATEGGQPEVEIRETQGNQGESQPTTEGEVVIGNHASEMAKLPQDFGGIQSSEYAKYLARSQIEAHILMSFSRSEVNKWSASLHQLETRGAEPQAIDLIHPSLHRSLAMMLREDGHLENTPINVAISMLRDAMNPEWRLVLDTIKRRTQPEVTSCEEQIIDAIKGYKLSYDEASISMMYQEANKSIVNNKGINGELSKQEWERVYHHLKKHFIKGQSNLSQATKVELERQLFLDQKMQPTLDDFFDTLSKAWKEVRSVYVKACQMLGYNKTQHQSQGRDNDRRNRSRSRSRSRDKKPSNSSGKNKKQHQSIYLSFN